MIEYEVNQSQISGFKARVRTMGEKAVIDVAAWTEEAARAAVSIMHLGVPRDSGLLSTAIRITGPIYRPGGLGGGGVYETRVDIDPFVAPHYRYVMEGTGMHYARSPHMIQSSKPMRWFDIAGSKVFRMSSEGQEPQNEWYDEGILAAQEHLDQMVAERDPFGSNF